MKKYYFCIRKIKLPCLTTACSEAAGKLNFRVGKSEVSTKQADS